MRRAVAVAVLAVPSLAWPNPDLEVRGVVPPLPRSLDMRPAAAALDLQPDSEPGDRHNDAPTSGSEPDDERQLEERLELDRRAELLPDLRDKIVFNLSLGFGLDGGASSGNRRLNGSELVEGDAYDAVRSYGFGDVVVGTRGLGASSLSTYFASAFRFNSTGARSYAIPNVYDGRDVDNVQPRSGYAEVDGLFDSPLLAPLRVRAGRQYHYGPAIAHFDGLTLAYETKLLELKLFSGRRVSYFGFDLDQVGEAGTVTGSSARLDLAQLIDIPVVLFGDLLRFDGLTHIDTRLAYQFDRNNSLLARARYFDGKVGRQALLLRSRLSKVTTISSELIRRTRNDYIYGMLLTKPLARDSTDARSYLSFGEVRPRLLFNLRAGTVLLRNIDLLLRGGFAADLTDTDEQRRSSYGVGYLEAGGALEVRLRRSIRLGASLLGRRYRRRDANAEPFVADTMPDPLLPDTGSVGEINFLEGGLSVRYSTGARKFTAGAEVYGRQYRFRSPYDPDLENAGDNRTGGRFSVEGWASQRIRIRAEYDVTRLPELIAVELRRVQTLRVLGEGRF